MFRITRIVGLNITSISRHQEKKFCVKFNSTVVQENEIDIKQTLGLENEKNKDPFVKAFAKVNDVPSLMKVATNTPKIDYVFKALQMLADWYETKNIHFQDVEKDDNYERFVSILEKQANGRSVMEVINAVKNLKKMGVPSDNFLIEYLTKALANIVAKKYQLCVLPFHQSLENDLLWKVRKVSIYSLLTVLSFQLQYQDTSRQKKVVEQTVATIERRWTEVKSPKDFCLIYGHCSNFTANFLGHIDDLVIENSETMLLGDLAKVLVAISASKRRPTPVIRSIAFRIFKKSEKLSPKQASNVIYAMNNLNFPDEALLEKLSSDLLSQIQEVDQPVIVRAVLVCMGQMRWRDKELLDALSDWVIRNINICKSNDAASLILTLAAVNYIPENIDELIAACSPLLTVSSVKENSIWVDIIWSLVVLGKATNEQVASVLEPTFASQFPIDDPSFVGTYLKLLNINAAYAFQQSYKGARLQPPNLDNLIITRSRKDLSLHDYVHKVLRNILPPPKYLRENVRTEFGFVVDAEMIMDRNCKPLSLTEFSSDLGGGGSTTTKPLPEGASRVALMVWNFKDFTVGSHSLTGQNSLAVKILNERRYKVVDVPFYDINKRENTIRSVQYFERKIKEAMSE